MRLVTVATHSERYFPVLVESCKRYNAKLEVLGWGKPWGGFMMKFNLLKDFLKGLPANEVVCFIDAYDVVLLSPLHVLEERFRNMDAHIVISRSGCASAFMTQVDSYFFSLCKNKNINSGTYIGYANAVYDMINSICTFHDCKDKSLDDQLVLSTYCQRRNDLNIKIDDNRDLFYVQCQFDKPKIGEIITSCIYHAPLIQNIHDVLLDLGYTNLPNLNDDVVGYYRSFIVHHWIKLMPIVLIVVLVITSLIVLITKRQRYRR